jgi:Protein of unknown function (DUF2721)
MNMTHSVDDVARIIQVALTPVFLLSGIAALLNVFAARSGRVADLVYKVSSELESGTGDAADDLNQLLRLRHRSIALDTAIILATLAGALTCLSAILLFLGTLRDRATASLLFLCFGMAILLTTAALTSFLVEMLLAGRNVRSVVRVRHSEAASDSDVAEPHAASDHANVGK